MYCDLDIDNEGFETGFVWWLQLKIKFYFQLFKDIKVGTKNIQDFFFITLIIVIPEMRYSSLFYGDGKKKNAI